MAKVVNCPCGEKITGDNDDELVKFVQEHGKAVHQQDVSRDDALAIAHRRLIYEILGKQKPVLMSKGRFLCFRLRRGLRQFPAEVWRQQIGNRSLNRV